MRGDEVADMVAFAKHQQVQQRAAPRHLQRPGLVGGGAHALGMQHTQAAPKTRLREVLAVARALADRKIDREVLHIRATALLGAQKSPLHQGCQRTADGVAVDAEALGERML